MNIIFSQNNQGSFFDNEKNSLIFLNKSIPLTNFFRIFLRLWKFCFQILFKTFKPFFSYSEYLLRVPWILNTKAYPIFLKFDPNKKKEKFPKVRKFSKI